MDGFISWLLGDFFGSSSHILSYLAILIRQTPRYCCFLYNFDVVLHKEFIMTVDILLGIFIPR